MIRHLTAATFILAVLAAAPAHAGASLNGIQGANGPKLNGILKGRHLNGMLNGKGLNGMLNGKGLNGTLNGKGLNGTLNGKGLNGMLNNPQIKSMLNGAQINGNSLQSLLGSSGLSGIELPR